jgi:hypothetical protein
MAYRLAPEAGDDLADIWDYVARESSTDIADRLVDSLTERSSCSPPFRSSAVGEMMTWVLDSVASHEWTVREAVRAQLRVCVKRILRKHGCPPTSKSAPPTPSSSKPSSSPKPGPPLSPKRNLRRPDH